MEGIEWEEPAFTTDEANDDLCNWVLSRFANSTNENHQHLCAVIGAMSQELKDHNLPSSPVAYLGAACSSLDRIASEPNPPNHIIDALLTIFSLVITRVPVAVLKKQREFLSELVIKVFRSPSVSESAVISALKCLSHLLINRESVDWSDVSPLFTVLLGFLADSRPKVRRQSHLCLRDVLLNIQNTSLLASASEGVTNLLERFLLLAGGANANAGEGTKGAQQVLYILDALKECLPFLSLKYKTSVLKYFKTLLDLRQPLVTRRITDGLNFLCVYPTSEVSPEALLELLISLALSISSNEMSGDAMTFTARLLDAGMNKIYSVNRQICVIKLPVVFNALKDILASEHEEAIHASTDALKSMINSCIDENLIKQGVDQIGLSENRESRKSAPTIIEKICATIESLLDYHYTAVGDRVFQVISSMFDKLGNYSPYFMSGILKNLEDVQKLPDEGFPFRKQLHECFGSALVAMGPETLLSLIPLNLEAEDLADANIWLFPILKHYIVGAPLNYFTEVILGMIKCVREKAQKLEKQGLMVSSRNADALVYSLWSLLPSFCNYPSDTAKSFMDLEKHLRSKLKEEPDIRGIICTSLQLLIHQNKNIDSNDKSYIGQNLAKEQVLAHYSQQVALDNLYVLKSSAKKWLKDLSEVFLQTMKDDGGCLQCTFGDVASIADKADVRNLFKELMVKLYKCTLKASKVGNTKNSHSMQIDDNVSPSVLRARFLDLVVSLLPGLDDEDIALLFQAIVPALQDVEGVMQKKAYKVLSIILRSSDSFVSLKFEELLKFMVEILPSCHFSAKRHRLDCLYFLIVHASKLKDNLDQWRERTNTFLTEIILALKEANKKTRNRAYDILVEIAHAFGDEEKGGNRKNLDDFFHTVAGSLVGETPHMMSAAAKGFLKVLVAKSQVDGLQMHLKSMVEGLLKWQNNTKNNFKAKVKLLLGMLVTKCGLEAVKAVMPEEHMKLLSNIRKIKERKERSRGAKSEETRSHLSKATTSRQSMWNHTKIFSDFDGDDDNSDAEHMISRGSKSSLHLKSAASSFRSNVRQKRNLPEHLSDQSDDEPLDLLDRQKTRSALISSDHLKRKSRLDDDEVEVDSEGRLIIREEGKRRKEKPEDPDFDTKSEPDSHLSAKSGTKAQKRRKTSDSGWAYTGKEYASRKAGGDVKRKDKLEPYAYWPLDRKMMSRRPQQRSAARKGMASVVKMTKNLEGKSASGVLSLKSLKLKRTQKKGSKGKKI
ncbi:RRP12-like protein isoform X2 [Abrus precatorius]|uniref:RRP12-like protein isoform X2 n=1 Tax=Abrus precatorius TaxID=3816 RepID=A0A8B8JD08_ABRPR|nr:RRP12-like protein isoform X2 [Abrus precatorius]